MSPKETLQADTIRVLEELVGNLFTHGLITSIPWEMLRTNFDIYRRAMLDIEANEKLANTPVPPPCRTWTIHAFSCREGIRPCGLASAGSCCSAWPGGHTDSCPVFGPRRG